MDKATINFPNYQSFSDYHEISDAANLLTEFLGKKVKSHEVGYSKDGYLGVFYISIKPTKEEVKKYLADNNIELL